MRQKRSTRRAGGTSRRNLCSIFAHFASHSTQGAFGKTLDFLHSFIHNSYGSLGTSLEPFYRWQYHSVYDSFIKEDSMSFLNHVHACSRCCDCDAFASFLLGAFLSTPQVTLGQNRVNKMSSSPQT